MLVPARAERGSGGERQNGVHLPRATSPPMTRLNCLALQGTSPGHTPVCVPSGMRQGPKGILPAAAHHAAALAFSIGAFHVRDPRRRYVRLESTTLTGGCRSFLKRTLDGHDPGVLADVWLGCTPTRHTRCPSRHQIPWRSRRSLHPLCPVLLLLQPRPGTGCARDTRQ